MDSTTSPAEEDLWFLGALATIKADGKATGGRVAVIEQLAPRGSGSPLHVHRNEDEWFYVLDGHLTFFIGDATTSAGPGSFIFGPAQVPHAFVVDSVQDARFLLVTMPAGFEEFVRELGSPATAAVLPPADAPMPEPKRLFAAAERHGMQILGAAPEAPPVRPRGH